MRVLWLTNKTIPRVEEARGKNSNVVNEGWIGQMFDQISGMDHIQLAIVCGGADTYAKGNGEGFHWYTFIENRKEETFYSDKIEWYFADILKEEKPDIIHIWGSEYPHTLEMVNAASSCDYVSRVVISIQGLISFCSMYYTCALPDKVVKYRTLFDYLRKTSIEDSVLAFLERGKSEIEAYEKVQHCIGRTEWDYYCVKALNQKIQYHHCNETLRSCFYSDVWKYQKCEPYSIFISQATYPLKGFHLLLQALPIIIKQYPDTHVYVSGADLTATKTITQKLKMTSYGEYLRNLLKKNGLQKKVTFMGRLDAEKMKQQYLRANVFVSCSSIENSPNSVGEAMLLGTPVVASNVGGTRTMLHAPEEGILYPWNSVESLAESVISVFSMPEKSAKKAEIARKHARDTHDSEKNFNDLLKIYSEIVESNTMNIYVMGGR